MAVTTKSVRGNSRANIRRDYGYYRDLVAGRSLPCAILDRDLLDENIAAIARRATHGKTIRVASKSVRSIWVLRRILECDPTYQGIMAFHPREAAFLAREGFDNILLGYPVWRARDIAEVCECTREGATIVFMVDSPGHVEQIGAVAGDVGVVARVCIDVDMSTSFPGLHFGVRRSPLRDAQDVVPLLEAIERTEPVTLHGVMGYEAQIAGLPDRAPGHRLLNRIIPYLKKRSIRDFRARRQAVVEAIRARGHDVPLVNGGGTGSIESTCEEEAVTEVTVGSGFYSPTQFDYYAGFRHQPALGFAIEIVRRPAPGMVTCAGGGYIASGPAGPDKLPKPYLPAGARLVGQEGAGEVQTPIVYDGPERLELGDPVFLRHTKAGELCERFNTLLVVSEGAVVDEVPTYRGQGQCFL